MQPFGDRINAFPARCISELRCWVFTTRDERTAVWLPGGSRDPFIAFSASLYWWRYGVLARQSAFIPGDV